LCHCVASFWLKTEAPSTKPKRRKVEKRNHETETVNKNEEENRSY